MVGPSSRRPGAESFQSFSRSRFWKLRVSTLTLMRLLAITEEVGGVTAEEGGIGI